MLSDRCPICLSCLSVCLSVTLVYCQKTVGWIKMKLGMHVGLGPGHIVLDRDPAPPPPKGHSPPNFRPISVVAKWLDGLRCGLNPDDCVRWGPTSLPKNAVEPPIFGLCLLWPNGCMHQDAT